jgi:hypothetical protein
MSDEDIVPDDFGLHHHHDIGQLPRSDGARCEIHGCWLTGPDLEGVCRACCDEAARVPSGVGASKPEPHPSRHAHPIAASDVGLGFSSGASHARGEKGVELSGSASAPVLPEPEPHPEAQTLEPVVVREMRENRNWYISHGQTVDQDESDFLDAWDVLVGRLEQKDEALREIEHICLTEPDAVNAATLVSWKAREALGVPPQPEETGGGKSRRSKTTTELEYEGW